MTARRARPDQALLGFMLLVGYAQAAWCAPAAVVGRVTGPDGSPLLARVVIATLGWKKSQVAFTDANGRYRLAFQTGKCRLTVTHGPEYSTAERTVELTTTRNRCDVQLEPILDMGARGWHAGDIHMHSKAGDGAQPPAAIAHAARCEGLDWAVLTDTNTTGGLDEWLAQGTPEFVPLPGQEIATSRGHILALGASNPISADTSSGASDIFRICTQIRAQRALAVLAHPMRPGMAYRDWDLRAYDAIEIINGTLPGYAFGFDMLQGRLKWHELLNARERIVALGGSDTRDISSAALRQLLADPQDAAKKHPRIKLLLRATDARTAGPFARRGNHPGAVRTYVHCPELTRDGILTALRNGATFVTTGPLLLATVDARPPGGTIALNGRRAITVTVEAASDAGLEGIDIIGDGEILKSISAAHSTRLTETFELAVESHRWLSIECRGPWPDMAVTGAWRLEA